MQRSVYSASCLRSSHQSYTTATSFVEFVAFLAFVAQKRQPRIPRLTRITGGGARRISRKILPLDISTTRLARFCGWQSRHWSCSRPTDRLVLSRGRSTDSPPGLVLSPH